MDVWEITIVFAVGVLVGMVAEKMGQIYKDGPR